LSRRKVYFVGNLKNKAAFGRTYPYTCGFAGVRNGILLVSHYQTLLAEGQPLREAVFQGSMQRLNPILMTALTAGLALIPLALGGGEPGKEIQTPMAIVILGGLLTSTFLNMVVVPVLFERFAPAEASEQPVQGSE